MKLVITVIIYVFLMMIAGCSHTEMPVSKNSEECSYCLGSRFMRQFISYDKENSGAVFHGGAGLTPCSYCKRKK
ncbi:MAG: hypothetical protein L0Y76_11905 [Ignavibacteria bacterium]|nr:hypothetical protein [Ignavibacteria bacterium]